MDADDQNRVGLLDAFDRGIEEIAGAAELRIELVTCLPAIERCGAEAAEQILEREHFLGTGKIARNGADLFGRGGFELLGDKGQRLDPSLRARAGRPCGRRADRAVGS